MEVSRVVDKYNLIVYNKYIMQETLVVSALNDSQLKDAIEDSAIARLNDRHGLLKATGKQQRIIEAYYRVLAETDDEVLALRAAREAAYLK